MENISYYVKGLFRGVEETDEVKEQKAELESHITDHMHDLIASGLSEEDAFEKTIAGLIYGIIYIGEIYVYLYRNGYGIGALYISVAGITGYNVPFVGAHHSGHLNFNSFLLL
jgi:hypothetical protein